MKRLSQQAISLWEHVQEVDQHLLTGTYLLSYRTTVPQCTHRYYHNQRSMSNMTVLYTWTRHDIDQSVKEDTGVNRRQTLTRHCSISELH
jgi:hypothetical protein